MTVALAKGKLWVLAFAAAMLCLAGFYAQPAHAATSGICGECVWSISSGGTLVIAPGKDNGKAGVAGDGKCTLANTTLQHMPPWYGSRNKVKSIVVKSGVAAGSRCNSMFSDMTNCSKMDVQDLDVSDAIDMGNMFSNDSSLTSLNLSGWNVKAVTEMSGLFYCCSGLASLDLSGWDTLNTTYMGNMFSMCDGLDKISLDEKCSLTGSGFGELDQRGWACAAGTMVTGQFNSKELEKRYSSESTRTSTTWTSARFRAKAKAVAALDKSITSLKTDADPKGSTFSPLLARAKKVTGSSVKLTWKRWVFGPWEYVVYGARCGKGNRYVRLGTVSGTSFTQKGLKKGTYYKYLVVALGEYGKPLATSRTTHVATTGGKAGNVKSVRVANAKKAAKLKRGKSVRLSVKLVPQSKKLRVSRHRALSFESSNAKVASVSKSGKVKAKKKGTAYVYAYAQNGVYAKVKVTVR